MNYASKNQGKILNLPLTFPKEPTTETELLTSQIFGLVRSEPPHIQKALLNVLKPLIAELRKMG